jgi:hypothetical protein
MGPPPWSFAADAHDRIMVPIPADRPNTRPWRDLSAPDGELPSDLSPVTHKAGQLDRPTEPVAVHNDGQ